MGVSKHITFDKYPEQSSWLNRIVKVCYEYDTNKTHTGRIIRSDSTEPGHVVILLDNGRVLLDTECQYSLL